MTGRCKFIKRAEFKNGERCIVRLSPETYDYEQYISVTGIQTELKMSKVYLGTYDSLGVEYTSEYNNEAEFNRWYKVLSLKEIRKEKLEKLKLIK